MRGLNPHLRLFPVVLGGRPETSACSSPGEPTTSKPWRPRMSCCGHCTPGSGGGVIFGVGAESAVAVPNRLAAVTSTRSGKLTSAGSTTYVREVAPAMSVQLAAGVVAALPLVAERRDRVPDPGRGSQRLALLRIAGHVGNAIRLWCERGVDMQNRGRGEPAAVGRARPGASLRSRTRRRHAPVARRERSRTRAPWPSAR